MADIQTKKSPSKMVASIGQLLQFAGTSDYVYILLALLSALVSSLGWPWFTLVNGAIIDAFVQYEIAANQTAAAQLAFQRRIFLLSGLQLLDALLYAASIYGTLYCFQMFALRQVNAYKRFYFRSVLRQEMAWLEEQKAGEFASQIAGDFKKIESGLNENLGLLITNAAAAVVQLATGLYNGWKLSLVILALTPIIFGCSAVVSKLQCQYSRKENEASAKASTVSEEAISAIRTVFAFGGQDKERKRYASALKTVLDIGWKSSALSALDMAVKWCTQYASLALGVWYGVKLVLDGEEGYSIGRVVVVFWCTSGFGYNVAFITPFWHAFQGARSAAAGIFEIIERRSAIDADTKDGEAMKSGYKADLELRNVSFAYPSRAEVTVLDKFNLKIKEGETVALVGASGCGKSTIIQLMQRFYDPNAGEVLLDGRNLKQLNPGWLRQQIGVVGQEPVLFDASIEENIRLGSAHMETVSQEDVERAAKEANAHEFISGLPEGYRTYVGDRGTQLSGGQKQRIAIARALISRPRVLLLDEATSALDLQSEHVVQAALDRASQGRTTIIVAHRLSTIINAHRIIVMDAGKILEIGTHSELMSLKSHYYNLYKAQEVSGSGEKTTVVADTAKSESISIETTKSSDVPADESSLDPAVISKTPHLRLFKLVWDLGPFSFIIAFAAAILYGLATPTYALILGSLVGVFGQSTDAEYLWSQTVKYVIFFVALSAAMFVFNILQISLFGFISGNLTMKLRSLAYSAILEQNIAWFDQSKNSSGALVARLANDAADIQGLTGLRIAMLCQALSTIIASVCIGFFFNWQLSLVALLLMPIVGASAIFASGLYKGQVRADGEVAEASGKVVIEVINAMKTVVSLHKQQFFLDRFSVLLDKHYQTAQSQVFKKAFVIAIAQGVAFFAYAVCYCFGGYLLGRGLLKSGDFFRISESMVFGALVVGRTAVFSSDYTKAKLAAYNIFKLIDSKPKRRAIQVANSQQSRCDGSVVVSNVHFSYPNRADSAVLSGLSFSAQKGQTVALVGASGCGKSTTIQLLEQFYEYSGEISLDGKDVAKLDVDWVRRQLALVQQEPILFSYSIRENIAYGDNSREVPFEEIVKAAQMANVHEFVAKLPQGYETPVGGKGAQLSGGQKQRIAIARSLVRDPPVLLLDEATSALDTASEKVVQAALDEAAKGRTCLVIAHRLKTIVNAHKIVVLDGGRNVEEGTHEELLARKGHYWRLYNSAIAS